VVALRRLFVAVPIGDEVRHALAARLRDVEIPGRPVLPPSWHVTLRFLGALDDADQDRLLHALDVADLGSRFSIRWGGLGAFPRSEKATVLWLGLVAGETAVVRLAETVDAAVGSAGLPVGERPVRPHITLSRIRPPRDVAGLIEATEPTSVRMDVASVVIMESHLDDGAARYEVFEAFEL